MKNKVLLIIIIILFISTMVIILPKLFNYLFFEQDVFIKYYVDGNHIGSKSDIRTLVEICKDGRVKLTDKINNKNIVININEEDLNLLKRSVDSFVILDGIKSNSTNEIMIKKDGTWIDLYVPHENFDDSKVFFEYSYTPGFTTGDKRFSIIVNEENLIICCESFYKEYAISKEWKESFKDTLNNADIPETPPRIGLELDCDGCYYKFIRNGENFEVHLLGSQQNSYNVLSKKLYEIINKKAINELRKNTDQYSNFTNTLFDIIGAGIVEKFEKGTLSNYLNNN